jgi:hypothetical protein
VNTAFVVYLTYVTVCVAAMQAAEREMEAARIRAVEMIAMAEAVGAQRVAASAASVNKMFDEHHPELAAAHPVLDSTGSPMPRAVSGAEPGKAGPLEAEHEAGSPAQLHSVARMSSGLPELTDIEKLSAKAMESIESASRGQMHSHHGCIFVTIHEAVDLKSASAALPAFAAIVSHRFVFCVLLVVSDMCRIECVLLLTSFVPAVLTATCQYLPAYFAWLLVCVDMEVFGKMSPFVTLAVAGALEEKRTATHEKGGKTPMWDEAFVFPVDFGDDEDVQLLFTVWDDENIPSKEKQNKRNQDDYCGSVSVSLSEVIRQDAEQVEGDEREWLSL